MPIKRIYELPAAVTIAAGDYLLVSQGGITKKLDISLLPGNTTSLAGLSDVDVTGNVAGALLAFNGSTWNPTTNTTNQIYDGGNF